MALRLTNAPYLCAPLFCRAPLGQNRAVGGDELGRILEDRLSKIIPAGFHVVYADDGLLWYSSDPGRFPGQTGSYRVGKSGTYLRDNFGSLGPDGSRTHRERLRPGSTRRPGLHRRGVT